MEIQIHHKKEEKKKEETNQKRTIQHEIESKSCNFSKKQPVDASTTENF